MDHHANISWAERNVVTAHSAYVSAIMRDGHPVGSGGDVVSHRQGLFLLAVRVYRNVTLAAIGCKDMSGECIRKLVQRSWEFDTHFDNFTQNSISSTLEFYNEMAIEGAKGASVKIKILLRSLVTKSKFVWLTGLCPPAANLDASMLSHHWQTLSLVSPAIPCWCETDEPLETDESLSGSDFSDFSDSSDMDEEEAEATMRSIVSPITVLQNRARGRFIKIV